MPTKAELEELVAELNAKLEAQETESDFPEASPGRSEILPGGGVSVGATLHLRVPTGIRSEASDHPTAAPASPDAMASVADAPEGSRFVFSEPFSFELADGGYVALDSFEVVHQPEAGRTVVKVTGPDAGVVHGEEPEDGDGEA